MAGVGRRAPLRDGRVDTRVGERAFICQRKDARVKVGLRAHNALDEHCVSRCLEALCGDVLVEARRRVAGRDGDYLLHAPVEGERRSIGLARREE
eukprot:scaffold202505_cov28-Tisochrysis_lutea.AAC.2